MSESIKSKISKSEQTCGCQGGAGFGVSRCKPLYIGCVNNKVSLYSTGNSIQDPMINHNGKESEKVYS